MDKPEGKKLHDGEMEDIIFRHKDCGAWTGCDSYEDIHKLLSHIRAIVKDGRENTDALIRRITALEGEVAINFEKALAYDILADENSTLKQKVEELEEEKGTYRSLYSVHSSNAHKLRLEVTKLQATIENMREAANVLFKCSEICNSSGRSILCDPVHKLLGHSAIVPKGRRRLVWLEDLEALKQACTEGEQKPCKHTNTMIAHNIKGYEKPVEACSDCGFVLKRNPCPDCGGWHVLDRVDLGCGGPQKPPRPKGDNPHG